MKRRVVMGTREVVGVLAAAVSFLAYPPYIVEFMGGQTKANVLTRWMWQLKFLGLKGGTRPHQASWLIWSALQYVIFASSREQGASSSTWMTLGYLVGSGLCGLLLFWYGEKSWKPLDYICAALACVSLY